MDIESGLEEAGFEVITASLPITPSKSLMQPLHSDKARGLDRVVPAQISTAGSIAEPTCSPPYRASSRK